MPRKKADWRDNSDVIKGLKRALQILEKRSKEATVCFIIVVNRRAR